MVAQHTTEDEETELIVESQGYDDWVPEGGVSEKVPGGKELPFRPRSAEKTSRIQCVRWRRSELGDGID